MEGNDRNSAMMHLYLSADVGKVREGQLYIALVIVIPTRCNEKLDTDKLLYNITLQNQRVTLSHQLQNFSMISTLEALCRRQNYPQLDSILQLFIYLVWAY